MEDDKLQTASADDTSKMSFMKKNMSLNSNFQIKTP